MNPSSWAAFTILWHFTETTIHEENDQQMQPYFCWTLFRTFYVCWTILGLQNKQTKKTNKPETFHSLLHFPLIWLTLPRLLILISMFFRLLSEVSEVICLHHIIPETGGTLTNCPFTAITHVCVCISKELFLSVWRVERVWTSYKLQKAKSLPETPALPQL